MRLEQALLLMSYLNLGRVLTHLGGRSQDLINICGSFLIGNAVNLLLIQDSSIMSKCEVLSQVFSSLTVSSGLFLQERVYEGCLCRSFPLLLFPK